MKPCRFLVALHGAGEEPECTRLWCLRDWADAHCARCDRTAQPKDSGRETHRLTEPSSEDELVCLDCPLPECDESDPRCPYKRSVYRRSLILAERCYSDGKRCPHPACHKPIVNTARTCVHHGWYK